jgi:hypothetical protein
MTFAPFPPYFSLYQRLKIRLKCRHFDTIVLIDAKSPAVLNSHKEHDFLDAFQNGRIAGNGAYAWKKAS